ncbi:hypothetical protein E4U42_005930 [Claviceps africana]|uniref:Uncharacterized protein n=1 Tax=Claviceps africana TaxID=83212 RepID=A0A8K0J3M1_9HYPO|nr:hypothetical protein E4U42_005930 [Claviceps africana]
MILPSLSVGLVSTLIFASFLSCAKASREASNDDDIAVAHELPPYYDAPTSGYGDPPPYQYGTSTLISVPASSPLSGSTPSTLVDSTTVTTTGQPSRYFLDGQHIVDILGLYNEHRHLFKPSNCLGTLVKQRQQYYLFHISCQQHNDEDHDGGPGIADHRNLELEIQSRGLKLEVDLDAIFPDVAASIQQYIFGLSYRELYSLSIRDSNKYEFWHTKYCMAHWWQFTNHKLLNVIYVSQYSGGYVSWSHADLDTPLFHLFFPNLDFTIDRVHGTEHVVQPAILESFQFNSIAAHQLRIVVGTVICFGNGHLLDQLEFNCERAYSEPDMVEQDCQRVSSIPEFIDHNTPFWDRAIHNEFKGKHDLPHSTDAVYSVTDHRHQNRDEHLPCPIIDLVERNKFAANDHQQPGNFEMDQHADHNVARQHCHIQCHDRPEHNVGTQNIDKLCKRDKQQHKQRDNALADKREVNRNDARSDTVISACKHAD